jgi:restriction system protein
MARRKESILDLLALLPWWVSVVTAGIVYAGLAYVAPTLTAPHPMLQGLLHMAPSLAPLFGIIFLAPAPVSAFHAWRKRRLLDAQKGIDSIRALSWREFEELVAEAYRRKGYRVIENTSAGADGGVDIRLAKDGKTHLVQCKHWRAGRVGVQVVREMVGVMLDQHAASVIVVTSGHFTAEARRFAAGKAIELIDGPRLSALIGEVRSRTETESDAAEATSPEPRCPRCGSPLVLRTARKGANAGNQFWGCTGFPTCRHKEPYTDRSFGIPRG